MKNKTEQENNNWESLLITQKIVLWHPAEKKFLLVKTLHNKHGEVWGRLGGHLEKGESTLDGLKREVMEEAGNIDYEIIGIIDTTRAELNPSLLSVSYLALYKDGEIELSDEHEEYAWFSAEEIEQNEKLLPSLKRVIQMAVERLKEREYLTDLQRLQADFSNYRRRQEESQKELRGFLVEKFLVDLLPVMDNFRMATGHVPAEQKDSPWVTGIGYIEQQLEKVLEENGVTTLAVSVGDVFDPAIHEAVSQASGAGSIEHEVRDSKQGEEGSEGVGENENGIAQQQTVAQVLQNGYKIGDRVVRPAKVVVG